MVLTQAQLAKKLGISVPAVSQATKRGRAVRNSEGQYDLADPVNSDYAKNSRRQRRSAIRKKAGERDHPIDASGAPPAARGKTSRRSRRVEDPDETEGESFNEAERRDKVAAANLKEQKLEITRGELLPRSQVKLVLSKIYAVHRAQFKTLGERIGPDLTATLGLEDSKVLIVQSVVDEDVGAILEQIKSEILAYLESIGDGEDLDHA